MLTKIELRQKIAEIDELIANGVTTARDSDGKSVSYRSLDDLKNMKEYFLSQLRDANHNRRPIGRSILVSRGL